LHSLSASTPTLGSSAAHHEPSEVVHWGPGQELVVVSVANSLLLRSKSPFPKTTVDDVTACLQYTEEAKTLDQMARAVAQGAGKQPHGID
jgi:hypothetical protein